MKIIKYTSRKPKQSREPLQQKFDHLTIVRENEIRPSHVPNDNYQNLKQKGFWNAIRSIKLWNRDLTSSAEGNAEPILFYSFSAFFSIPKQK